MSIGVAGDRRANIQARHVVLKVDVEEVRVYRMRDISGDEVRVRISLVDQIGTWRSLRERINSPLDHAGQEIALSTLTEERTDFFVVEEGDELDDGGFGRRGGVVVGVGTGVRRAEESLEGRPGAEFVVDAAAGDELFVETGEGCGLEVVELELPADDVADCERC